MSIHAPVGTRTRNAGGPPRAQWPALLRLLETALDVAEPRRAAWLEALTTVDTGLRRALGSLLDQRGCLERSRFLEAAAPGPRHRRGERIGPWTLQRELGAGGMASVWLAERHDGTVPQRVALKLPHPGAPGAAARLRREGALLAALAHPHVVALHAAHDGAAPWLALEPIDGSPITAHAAERRLGVRARLELFAQLLQALAHAHARRVIHRDLKPANVLVDRAGRVVLIDFGIALPLDAPPDTPDGALWHALTPPYAAPEQFAGGALTPATDVYALGLLLSELLAGADRQRRAPPPGRGGSGAAAGCLRRGGVAAIVRRALRTEPRRRYASADEFACALEQVLADAPLPAVRAAWPPTGWHHRVMPLASAVMGNAMDWIDRAAGTAAVAALVLTLARSLGLRAAGMAAALPWVSAPTLLWVARDRGDAFAAASALGCVAAAGALALFVWSYALLARRPGAVPVAATAAAAGAPLLAALAADLPLLLAAVCLLCAAASRALPRAAAAIQRLGPVLTAPGGPTFGGTACALPMVLTAALLSALLAALASTLGAAALGVLAAAPIAGAVTLAGLHRRCGRGAGLTFARGYLIGIYANLLYALLFSALVGRLGAPAALSLALSAGAALTGWVRPGRSAAAGG